MVYLVFFNKAFFLGWCLLGIIGNSFLVVRICRRFRNWVALAIVGGSTVLCLSTALEMVFFDIYTANINIVSLPLNCPLYY